MEQNHDQNEQIAGVQLFAENLRQAAEQGGAPAIDQYLHDVIADTENVYDPSERHAALSVMAGEQRAKNFTELGEAGQSFVSAAEEAIDTKLQQIIRPYQAVRSNSTETANQHRGIRRYVDQFNVRGSHAMHEDVTNKLKSVTAPLQVVNNTVREWSASQHAISTEFATNVEKNAHHEKAIFAGLQTLEPEYEGEPKDLTRLIDPSVRAETADKLQAALLAAEQDGTDIQDVLAEAIPLHDYDQQKRTAAQLYQISKGLEAGGQQSDKRLNAETQQTVRIFQQFASRGRDAYLSSRSPGQLQEAFATQQRMLDGATMNLQAIIDRPAKELRGYQDQIKAARRLVKPAA